MDLSVRTTLRHLALVTWAVPADGLAALLPTGLVPHTVASPRGPQGLFSLAVMIETGMAAHAMPWLALTFPQLNERAYVTRPDGSDPGVYFWRSEVASLSGILPRVALGLPYYQHHLDLAVTQDTLTFTREGTSILALALTTAPDVVEPGVDLDRVRAICTNPMVGYSLQRGTHLVRFAVEHPPMVARDVSVTRVLPDTLHAAPLLTPGQPPLLASYVTSSDFTVHLPPERVA